jgi:hypothetical protein
MRIAILKREQERGNLRACNVTLLEGLLPTRLPLHQRVGDRRTFHARGFGPEPVTPRSFACPVGAVVAGQKVLHSLAKRVQSDFRRTVQANGQQARSGTN